MITATGMMFTIVQWNHDDLHNRYIITDRGGIQVGEGLDEAHAASTRSDDVLTIISLATAAKLMDRYCGSVDKAKQLLQHRIIGRKPTTP